MHYEQRIPCPALRPYVVSYWQLTGSVPANEIMAVPVITTGQSHISFYLGSAMPASSQMVSSLGLYENALVGPLLGPHRNYLSGQIANVGIKFTPTGLFALWGFPTDEFQNKETDLGAILGSVLRVINEQLREASNTLQRFQIIETWLMRQLVVAPPTDGRIEKAVHLIDQRATRTSIPHLAYLINCSVSTLERRFVKQVGTSPKMYARIRRFTQVRQSLQAVSSPDWHDILAQGHYFDQAHFIKDITYFTGYSPTQFCGRLTDYRNFLSAIC